MKIVKKLLAILLILLVVLIGLTILTPYPASWTVRQLFKGGAAVPPDNYDDIQKQVKIKKGISYESDYSDGLFDLHSPKGNAKKLPVIFWVHGGAYVGGDRSDITEYATGIAAKGYIVVNMDYKRAPEGKYPIPLNQIAECYDFVSRNAESYNIDLNQVIFAGDSAGAQMISQYVNAQVNKDYALATDIPQLISPKQIAGVLLFCGPYDLVSAAEAFDKRPVIKFIVGQIARGYIGTFNWQDDSKLSLASTLNYVDANFPSTFITDGNKGTFTEQGLDFAKRLETNEVYVDPVFYDIEIEELGHEYQFNMSLESSKDTYRRLILFLDKITEEP